MTVRSRPNEIVVTGASGWLGQSFLRLALEPWRGPGSLSWPGPELKIRAVALPGDTIDPALLESERVQWICGDLRDAAVREQLVRGASGSTLFQLAGIIHPRRVREFYEINVEANQRLLEDAEREGVARAVVMSSNSPMGTNPHPDHLFDENCPYNPYMNYGRSKMLLEKTAHVVAARGKLEVVIVRAPWFYGPGQPHRQTFFFTMIRDGKGPILGRGDQRRSMAYLDNLVQGLLLAAERQEAAGQTYWIADERPYEMKEILDTIERLLESEFDQKVAHQRLKLPNFVGDAAYLADRLIQGLGLYQQKIHVLSEMNKSIACSVEKARRELGYRPQIALEEGMRRSLKDCARRGLLF